MTCHDRRCVCLTTGPRLALDGSDSSVASGEDNATSKSTVNVHPLSTLVERYRTRRTRRGGRVSLTSASIGTEDLHPFQHVPLREEKGRTMGRKRAACPTTRVDDRWFPENGHPEVQAWAESTRPAAHRGYNTRGVLAYTKVSARPGVRREGNILNRDVPLVLVRIPLRGSERARFLQPIPQEGGFSTSRGHCGQPRSLSRGCRDSRFPTLCVPRENTSEVHFGFLWWCCSIAKPAT